MSFCMLKHVIFSNETFATLRTSVGFTATVQAHVSSQIGFVIESLWANLTFEWFIVAVLSEMFLVRGSAVESFTTALAFEGLISAMASFIVLS